MKKLGVTIHIGALHDEVIVGGVVFDRSKMSREHKKLLSTRLIDILLAHRTVRRKKKSELRAACASV